MLRTAAEIAGVWSMVAAGEGKGHQPSRRHRMRYRVQSPLDVTVLRSGIPDTLPGRSVNLGEGGIAAVLAGELLPGETVGVEIKLSMVADPLRARALVRHYDKLRFGMEFVGLSLEQQAAIRDWAAAEKAEPDLGVRPIAIKSAGPSEIGGSGGAQPPAHRRRRRVWVFFLLAAVILLAGLWWRWRRGWKDLESNLPNNTETVQAQRPEVHVPSDVMEKLIIHRVDPEYPAAARQAKLQGVIALDLVVGRDGSVVFVKALNGPEILSNAAIEALRWWRFEPYLVEGKPVVVETTVAVVFKP